MNPGLSDRGGPDESAPSPGDLPEAAPPDAIPLGAREPPPLPDAPTTIVDVPANVVADPPVSTETVGVAPVLAAAADRPDGPRRVGGRVAAVIAVFAILAIGAVAYYGYSLNQDLESTRSNLATTQGDLDSTTGTLEDTAGSLAATKGDLAARTSEKDTLDSKIKDLSAQVATQTNCVRLQQDALGALVEISDLQTANFNRTAENSAWATAEAKRGENITAALDQFYEAYKSAFQGATGTAKSHADRGKAAQSKIAEAETQQVAELKLVDEKAAEIQARIDNLEQQLVEIETTCGEVAP